LRTSFCSIALRDENIRHIIPQVAQTGYEGVEIWGTHLEKYREEGNSLNTLKHLLEDHHLTVPVISRYKYRAEEEEQSAFADESSVRYQTRDRVEPRRVGGCVAAGPAAGSEGQIGGFCGISTASPPRSKAGDVPARKRAPSRAAGRGPRA
jgi:sugar phosphate isomerase/epimerase